MIASIARDVRAGSVPAMPSAMRETMERQPADLRTLLADREPAARAAERHRGPAHVPGRHGHELPRRQPRRLAAARGGRRGARGLGVSTPRCTAPGPVPGTPLVLLSHTGHKRYSRGGARRGARRRRPHRRDRRRAAPPASTSRRSRSSAPTPTPPATWGRCCASPSSPGSWAPPWARSTTVPDAVADALGGPGPASRPLRACSSTPARGPTSGPRPRAR